MEDTSVKYSDVEYFFEREGITCFHLALSSSFLTLCRHGIMSQNAKKYEYALFLLLWQGFYYLTFLTVMMINSVTIFTGLGQFLFSELKLLVF